MSKLWEELVESGVIDSKVQEALEQKLEEVKADTRSSIEEEVRAEFSARLEKDKGDLIQAMDKFLNEAISRELSEFQEDRKEVKAQKTRLEQAVKEARTDYNHKIAEHTDLMKNFMMKQLHTEIREFAGDRQAAAKQRVKLSRAILEARQTYESKLAEHMDLLKSFMFKQLHEEIAEFSQDKKILEEQKRTTAKKLREHRVALQEQFANRQSTLETFILEQLKKEIGEFHEDKKALVEQRVKLQATSKQEIAEAKKKFVERASKIVESTLTTQLQTEMEQFKDDIKSARQNHFGRKIFEAFSAEFMSSYLSEGTKVKQVMNKLDEAQAKITATEQKLTEMAKAKEVAERKITLAEDKSRRAEIMNDLLAPLKGQKKGVMSNLLESVKTDNLKAAYQKFLPHVLNEGKGRKTAGRATLTEGRKVNTRPESADSKTTQKGKIVESTGNRVNRLAESVQAEQNDKTVEEVELNEFLHLAGINR